MYIDHIENSGTAVAGSEIITPEKALNEFVMLELRSSGLRTKIFENRFGTEASNWLKKNYHYFETLKNKNFLISFD